MTHPSINIQIKSLRKNLGLTQIDFAKRVGVGLRFLRELEKGKATVRLDKLNQVLDFLGVHLELMRNEKIESQPKDKKLNFIENYGKI
jgi:y4mF family transcriptional regulator